MQHKQLRKLSPRCIVICTAIDRAQSSVNFNTPSKRVPHNIIYNFQNRSKLRTMVAVNSQSDAQKRLVQYVGIRQESLSALYIM